MDEGIGGGLDELSSNGTNRSRSRRLGPDYTEEKVKCKTFLRMYKSNTRTTGTFFVFRSIFYTDFFLSNDGKQVQEEPCF